MDSRSEIKFGVQLSSRWLYPTDDSVRTFILADKIGFDSIWVGDHLAFEHGEKILNTWMSLAIVADKTKKAMIGTAVTDPHRYHPAVLAQQASTLDILSNGRFILGIGAGQAMNLDPYGITWKKPLERMVESVELIKKFWTKEKINHKGKYFNIKEAYLEPKPVAKPHPPIWVGGTYHKTLKYIGEKADGWLPGGSSPKIYNENLNVITKWAKKSGRNVDDVQYGIILPTAVSTDYDLARKYIEYTTKEALLTHPKTLEKMGAISKTNEFNRYSTSKLVYTPETTKEFQKVADSIPFDAVKSRSIFGSPDDCISQLENYIKAGANHIVIRPQSRDPSIREEFLKEYQRKILPYFENK
jgi:alkanesulfonate monooxygenase SsuD/methylene tetrahydromethanopterin reductase-like flavin-dependent oxidoreductase (luciferase family)